MQAHQKLWQTITFLKRMDYGWKHNETLTNAIKITVIVNWCH